MQVISATILPLQYLRPLRDSNSPTASHLKQILFCQMLGRNLEATAKIPIRLNRRDHTASFFKNKNKPPPKTLIPELTEVQKNAHLRILVSQTFTRSARE
uniref:Uncharacterized protein n=1 Tax=Micrurus spixii TaxID=129469 RepID=A0A2D4NB41_9SAUR